MCAYMCLCEHHIKVASYIGFYVKHIRNASSSQVKLKVKLALTSNTALVLGVHMHDRKNVKCLPGDENKQCY